MRLEADPSAFPRSLCLPSSCCPAFRGGCSCQPRAGVRGGPCRPHCQLWVLHLPLLAFPGAGAGQVSQLPLWEADFPNALCSSAGVSWLGGPEGTPGLSSQTQLPPRCRRLCSHLRNFPQSGQWDPGGFHCSASQQLQSQGGVPPSPAQPSAPALAPLAPGPGLTQPQQDGQCHVPATARGIFPHPCPGLWDECGEALERVLGPEAASVSGASRKQLQVTLVL